MTKLIQKSRRQRQKEEEENSNFELFFNPTVQNLLYRYMYFVVFFDGARYYLYIKIYCNI